MEHPIGSLMDTTMEKIKEMIDVNTIIGEPITSPDGTLIIPVSKVATALRQAVRICLPKRKQRLLWRRQRCRCDNSACCISYRLSGRCKACVR